jgi:redox-sensitive bicupin YhaK (pirin superfamily)
VIRAGGVQWMTAGRGIVHSEMPEQEEGLMSGFQLWINLPASEKMTEPRYQDIPAACLPVVTAPGGGLVKVIAGALEGTRGPVAPASTEPLFLDVALAPGSAFETSLPPEHSAFAYVYEGSAAIGPVEAATTLAPGRLGVLGPGNRFLARAGGDSARLILLAGRPIKEPVAKYGPFVMNTKAELYQAFADYEAGRL